MEELAPEVGFEPTTSRLTAGCSTIELLWNPKWNPQFTNCLLARQFVFALDLVWPFLPGAVQKMDKKLFILRHHLSDHCLRTPIKSLIWRKLSQIIEGKSPKIPKKRLFFF